MDTRLQQLAKTDRNPVEETEYQNLLKQAGGISGGGYNTDYASLANQMYSQLNQYKQPAINTLEASRGNIQNIFNPYIQKAEAQKPLIEQQYQNALADITKSTREATTAEMTRRGIPISSGIVENTVGTRLAPQISAQALSKAQSLQGIQDLIGGYGSQQAQQNLNLDQAIAAIQAATGQDAISAALSLFNSQQAQVQNQAELDFQKQIAASNAANQSAQLNQLNTEIVTAGGRKLLIDKQTGSVISDLGSSSEGTGDGSLGEILKTVFANGIPNGTPTEPKPTYTPKKSMGASGGW